MAVTLRPAPQNPPRPLDPLDGPLTSATAPRRRWGAPGEGGRREGPRSRRAGPLTFLVALTAGATALLGALLLYMMGAIFKEVVPPMAGFGVLALLAGAVVVAVRRRWTPLLGSVVALLLGLLLILPGGDGDRPHLLGQP